MTWWMYLIAYASAYGAGAWITTWLCFRYEIDEAAAVPAAMFWPMIVALSPIVIPTIWAFKKAAAAGKRARTRAAEQKKERELQAAIDAALRREERQQQELEQHIEADRAKARKTYR